MLEDILKKWGGSEVSAMDVYSDIFDLGSGSIQKENEAPGEYKANPLGYWKNESQESGHFRIMFEDTFEDTLKELQRADFGLLNGVTYFGRKRDQNHASKLYAMIFDLDDVTDSTLNNFLNGAFEVDAYPIPNYICLSGNNVHLYYVFEDPIPLFPNIKLQLKDLKYALTEKIWNPYTSNAETKQKQGIFQPFRVIGGKTKKGAAEKTVRAFRINNHPFSLKQLCEYVPKEHYIDESKLFKESKISLAEAAKKYPKWYKKVIVEKDRTPDKWDIPGKVNGDNPYALYDWWLQKVRKGASFNHRYFCVMCLVIYAVKCSVPYEKVKKDAYDLVPFLNSIKPEEPFTRNDVDSALECYDDRYCTFPIKDISVISAIPIEKNRRNGQKQEYHLEEARAIRDIRARRRGEAWDAHNGRKSKRDIVLDWRRCHDPDAKKVECQRDTGLSRPTIRKWWNIEEFEREQLQREADELIFSESEITPEFEAKLIEKGISVKVVPDEEYPEALMLQWLDSLKGGKNEDS